MKSFLEQVKLVYIIALRNIRKVFFVFPLKKNRVIFESFSGDGYSCNPKYISEYLKKEYGNSVEVVWAVKDGVKTPENVVACKYRSFQHFLYRITSKVYVCNFLQAIEIPKRKAQIEIQTWHGGGCYKKIGNEEKLRNSAYEKRRDMHLKEIDYFIVSSLYWEQEVCRKQLGYTGKILEIGMPRNDCLVKQTVLDKKKSIRKKIGISEDCFAVLYAPTWREGLDQFELIDYEQIKAAFEKRFDKKCEILFRAHIYGKEKLSNVIDLTQYPDMQELLYTSDALITDYSSSMWDYSLTGRPCFLYVPDLQRYIKQRSFDMDIHTWGFPVCCSNRELKQEIENFNENEFRKKMICHQNTLGSFENGKATIEAVKLIAQLCELKK